MCTELLCVTVPISPRSWHLGRGLRCQIASLAVQQNLCYCMMGVDDDCRPFSQLTSTNVRDARTQRRVFCANDTCLKTNACNKNENSSTDRLILSCKPRKPFGCWIFRSLYINSLYTNTRIFCDTALNSN